VTYGRQVQYQGKPLPGFALDETEVYLNHVFTSPKQKLLGVKVTDPKSGKVYMQDTAGWYQAAEKGWVFYFMAGHSTHDFDSPAYSQIVVNAFTWKP
jgi:type 1 glutamine amidotransferase